MDNKYKMSPPLDLRANERAAYRLRFAAKVKIQYGARNKCNIGAKLCKISTPDIAASLGTSKKQACRHLNVEH